MNEQITKVSAFKLKGRFYTFTVLHMMSTDIEHFDRQCAEVVVQAPKLFDRAPVVFDISGLGDGVCDFKAWCRIAKSYNMIPVAIQGGGQSHELQALEAGLGLLNAGGSHERPVIERTIDTTPSAEPSKSKFINTPVRSGQQIVAKGSDLIVMHSVSHGAELLADGNIHIYGALRGRALAGLSGDLSARIFCQSLEAELLCIAGFYRLSEAIEPVPGPCQIYLAQEHIVVEPLSAKM